jgi:16S rRNA processing protein RimM
MSNKTPQLVMIGEVVRSHALRGTVKVRVVADTMEEFSRLRNVQLQRGDQALGEYVIENLQIANGGLLVKFRGVDDRNQAEHLRGAAVMMALAECPAPAPDEFYHFDLIGLPVFTASDEPVGDIVEILRYPANDVWVIRQGASEKLIPAIDSVIQKVDLPNRRVIITPMPGLLE